MAAWAMTTGLSRRIQGGAATLAPMRPILPARLLRVACALLVTLAIGACSPAAADPAVSFDPSGPCTGDGQRPGAYPELEALLPNAWEDQPPASLESGRTCTTESLGTLATHGIEELRFGGATWETGGASGFNVAVFEAEGLDPEQMLEFYEAGARALRSSDTYEVSDVTVAGRPAMRLDVVGVDGSAQTVVAWSSPADGRVFALRAANMGDARIAGLLELFGDR